MLSVSPEQVWLAMKTPEVLQYCIKGCDRVIQVDEYHYTATFRFGWGPVKKEISAQLEIEDVDPPGKYRLDAGLETRRMGKAGGVAHVSLHDENGGCRLNYQAEVSTTGWFAGFNDMILAAAADRAMKIFFERLEESMT